MIAFTKARRAASVDDFETWIQGGVCPTLNAFDNATETRATVVAVPIAFSHTQGLDVQPSESAWPTLRTGGGGHAVSVMGSVTHTLTSEGADASEDGSGRGTPVVTQGQQQVRRLTPRECERLQGFPDDWTAGQADSHRYKQLGNAVTVNVAHYVACLLNMALDSKHSGAEHE